MGNNKLNILFIDDDQVERLKIKRTVDTNGLEANIIDAFNGEEALSILESGKMIPDIIILDLNMPRMNGIEFLRKLKGDSTLKFIPTIILTTSSNDRDLMECYKIGIAGYMLKPLKYEVYEERIKTIFSYWSISELARL